MMDCATFENRLAELLSSGVEGAERDGGVRELLDHAAACPPCRGCAALLELLEGPREGRDPFPDPGPRYWESFEARLQERLAAPARSPAVLRRAAVAAAVVVALAGVWLGLRQRVEPAAPVAQGGERSPSELPPLAEVPSGVPPEDASAQLDALTGWSLAADPDDGLFPDVSELDREAGRALLAWLREQSS
jgi:hypothetical protein